LFNPGTILLGCIMLNCHEMYQHVTMILWMICFYSIFKIYWK